MTTPYTISYAIKYSIPSIQQQIETAVMTAAGQIQNEDPSTADHANRIKWADWANKNSAAAAQPFGWPVAMNSSVQAEVTADPTGGSVKDSDVQFIVNSFLEAVITDWIASPLPR